MPSPRENPALWDYVVIGDVVLPPDGVSGHVKVTVKPKVKDDKKSPTGKTGGRTTQQGLDLADVDIELEWQDAPGQYDLVQAAINKIWPPPATAQGVAHGTTDLWGIRDITVRSADGPEWSEGKGKIKLGCREWKPPAAASGAGTGGKAGGGSLAELKAKLAAAQAKLAKIKANNFQDETEVLVLQSEIASLQALIALYGSNTNTPSSADPTQQFAKGGGIPLGEIQPADRVPLGEVQP